MPRYYFDLLDHEIDRDERGTELADAEQARLEGVKFATDYLAENPELIWNGREIRTVVRDEHSRVLLTIVTLAIDGY